jgi:hypothetical protein
VQQPEALRGGGEALSWRPTIDDGEIGLEPAKLGPLTGGQEAEVVELLAVMLAAAARRRAERGALKEAA